MRVNRSIMAGSSSGACFYEGGVPEVAAFAPGCPGGTTSLVADAVLAPSGFPYVLASALVFEERGRAGHGNWFTGGGVDEVGAVSVQVPLGF
jgi:hypothetical protein